MVDSERGDSLLDGEGLRRVAPVLQEGYDLLFLETTADGVGVGGGSGRLCSS